MRGRTDGTDDYIHIEDRLRWLLLFLKRDRIETVGNNLLVPESERSERRGLCIFGEGVSGYYGG